MARFDRRAVAGLATVLIVTGCSDGDTYDSSSSAAKVGTSTQDDAGAPQLPIDLGVIESVDLRCEESVIATDPPYGFDVVLDTVALPASPPYPNALQTSARTANDGTIYYFAKTGLSWTGEHSIELEVPEELRPTLAIGWGGPAQPSHAVRLNCPGANGWTASPGGYWVLEPICAEIIVRVDGDEARVRIGLGRPCEGQDPPAGPSDG